MNLKKSSSLSLVRDPEALHAVMLLRYGEKFPLGQRKPLLNITTVSKACGISTSHAKTLLKLGEQGVH
jgi:hypothetical protein